MKFFISVAIIVRPFTLPSLYAAVIMPLIVNACRFATRSVHVLSPTVNVASQDSSVGSVLDIMLIVGLLIAASDSVGALDGVGQTLDSGPGLYVVAVRAESQTCGSRNI